MFPLDVKSLHEDTILPLLSHNVTVQSEMLVVSFFPNIVPEQIAFPDEKDNVICVLFDLIALQYIKRQNNLFYCKISSFFSKNYTFSHFDKFILADLCIYAICVTFVKPNDGAVIIVGGTVVIICGMLARDFCKVVFFIIHCY